MRNEECWKHSLGQGSPVFLFFFLNCAPKVDPFCRHLNFGFKDYSRGPEYCDNT